MCLKSQHFQCVFGVENDHPTIGTARLFLRRGISFETELPCVQFCYLRQHIAWLLREQKRSKVASFFGTRAPGTAPGRSGVEPVWASTGRRTAHFTRSAGSARAHALGAGRLSSTCPAPHTPATAPQKVFPLRTPPAKLTQSRRVGNGCFLNQIHMESKIWGENGAMRLI